MRLALVAENLARLAEQLARARTGSAKLLAARGIFASPSFFAPQPPGQMLPAGEVAFLFPGQGSQYLGMLEDLAGQYDVVRDTFAEADRALAAHLPAPLTSFVWPSSRDDAAEHALRQTEFCQPAMLAADVALARLLASHGVRPQRVAGHSLGEYAAAVVAGVLPFADALFAVSARGREMANVRVDDPGQMAMVAADAQRTEAVLARIDGYVIAANKNCFTQTVIAGATHAVEQAMAAFADEGIEARAIAVSHAFHSAIVAPAAEPLTRVLQGLGVQAPSLPLSSNVDADYFPSERQAIIERMGRQLASPVQFIGQLQRLYADGARIFVEVGPKRALTGFVRNVLADRPHAALASNHPKRPGPQGIAELLAALLAEGVPVTFDRTPAQSSIAAPASHRTPSDDAIVISGVSALLPGGQAGAPWQADAFAPILRGDNCIERIDAATRDAMLRKRIVRLEKQHGRFREVVRDDEVVQLAAKVGAIDVGEWGVDAGLAEALDATAKLALAAAIEALRDAGLPLCEHQRTTSTGTALKDRWGLPRAVGERTGVILASAFAGLDAVLSDVDAAMVHGRPFDRKWLLRALPMGHAQVAELVQAQGPSALINAACASGTQAIGMASDWIRLGRCDRVIVVTADDVTAEASLPWVGAGFLAAGAATTQSDVTKAAIPFSAERNGMVIGSGAAAFIVERQSSVFERGMVALAELVACEFANSAFHATRLDPRFIRPFLARAVAQIPDYADAQGPARLAGQMAFLSHETYTPARGGSAAAEVDGLRHVFGEAVGQVLIANTKGFTGHPMGASFEDVVAIKGLQRQELPPIANLRQPDPDFADLRFSRGGAVSIDYALRFAAGFGSQVAVAIYRRVAQQEARLADAAKYAAWCETIGLPAGATFEVRHRRLQVASRNGSAIDELGIASLESAAPSQLARPTLAQAAPAASAAPPFRIAAAVDATKTTAARAPIAAMAARAASDRTQRSPAADSRIGASDAQPSSVNLPSTYASADASADAALHDLTTLFAEQTGYELAELEPDHAIEADLGIDSIKQAEILAVVRAKWQLDPEAPMALAELTTLRKMAEAVAARAPSAQLPRAGEGASGANGSFASAAGLGTTPPSPALIPAAHSLAPRQLDGGDAALAELSRLFAEHTGYDAAELDPDHAIEADLGIDSIKQAEILAIVRERWHVAADAPLPLSELSTLRKMAEAIGALAALPQVADASTEATAAAPAGPLKQPAQAPSAGAPPASAAATSPATTDPLARLTALFSEQTGYHPSELDPDFSLEADLGIDSVKQAEIIAVVRTEYGLGEATDLKLSELQSLRAIAGYLEGQQRKVSVSAEPTPSAPSAKSAATGASNAASAGQKEAVDDAANGPATGPSSSPSPGPAAAPPGPLSGPLEMSGVRAAAVALLPASPPVAPSATDAVAWLSLATTAAPANSLPNELAQALAAVPTGGADADVAPGIAGAHVVLWAQGAAGAAEGPQLADAQALFRLVREWRKSGSAPRSVVALTQGGGFGFATAHPQRAQAAAVSGVLKALALEWPEVVWRAVDLASLTAADAAPAAAALRAALFTSPAQWPHAEAVLSVVEGIAGWSVPARLPHALAPSPRPLAEGSLIVVTGGARGVTFELVRALAARRPLHILSFARTHPFAAGEDTLANADDAVRKADAKRRLEADKERATPAAIRRLLARDEARREVGRNLASLRSTGSQVEHVAGDVTCRAARARLAAAVQRHGQPVSLLLHGAGIEESRAVQDKAEGDFARIAAPKYDALVACQAELQPARTVAMGSIAGRFGNAGQLDYAAANNALSAAARGSERPFLTVAWSAWDEVGMATRGSVRQVLRGHGVGLLPLAVGVAMGVALIESDATGEVVVAGALGALAKREHRLPPLFSSGCAVPMPVLTRRFDAKIDPGLDHHRIDGVAVLPGVLGVECMLQAARFVSGRPVCQLADVLFEAPIKFHRDHPLDVDVEVAGRDANGLRLRVCTTFVGPGGRPQRRIHFRATALYDPAMPPVPAVPPAATLVQPALMPLQRRDIYARYFHGPLFQTLAEYPRVGDQAVEARSTAATASWGEALAPADWQSRPFGREAAFQAAGLWEMAERCRMALPAGIDAVWINTTALTAAAAADAPVHIAVHCRAADEGGCTFDIVQRAIEADGSVGLVLDIMRGYRSVVLGALAESDAFERVRLPAAPAAAAGLAQATLALADVEPLLELDAAGAAIYLAVEERRQFARLRMRKRRLDWLAGRIVAKRCVLASWPHVGPSPRASDIVVGTTDLGEPTLSFAGAHGEVAAPKISISHGGGIAMAACSWQADRLPGVDVQPITRRDAAFGKTYFTLAEQSAVAQAVARKATRPELAWTVRWALKEAALKALGIGARVDFKDLVVTPLAGEQGERWQVEFFGQAEQHLLQRGAEALAARLVVEPDRVVVYVVLKTTEGRTRRPSRARAS